MTYKELLGKVRIDKTYVTNRLRFVLLKSNDTGFNLISESRDLTEQEILGYTTMLIDFLLSKGNTEISEPDTGEVWKFSKEEKQNEVID